MRIAFPQDNEELIQKISNDLEQYKIEKKDADIGGGADLWVTILIITATIFFSGKKINENLNAWIEIGAKFKNLFNQKNKPQSIDKEAAIALAISIINDKTIIKNIELVSSKELNEKPNNTKGFNLEFSPYNYYILIFKINDIENFIFCIKSNGEIRFKDYFENTEWNFQYDWESFEDRENYT